MALYMLMRSATGGNRRIHILKTTGDPTTLSNWSIVGGSVQHNQKLLSIWGEAVDGKIHVATQDADGRVGYSLFDTATDTWSVSNEEAHAGDSSATWTNAAGCSVAARHGAAGTTTHDAVVLFTRWYPTNSRFEIMVSRRVSAVWTKDQLVRRDATADLYAGVAIHGLDDRTHLLFTDATNSDLRHRTYTNANSLQADQQIDASASTTLLRVVAVPGTYITDGGESGLYVTIIMVDSDGQVIEYQADSIHVPSWSSKDAGDIEVKENPSTAHPVMATVLDGTTPWVLKSGGGALGVDQDIYSNWRDRRRIYAGGSYQGSDTEENDAVTCNAISAGTYWRVNLTRLGYLWLNGTTVTFSEVAIDSTFASLDLDNVGHWRDNTFYGPFGT